MKGHDVSMNSFPIQVDIVSDVVCPWCVIGYLQLAKASEQTGIPIQVRWQPFELNPQMGAEGENLREHLAAKYGISPEGSRQARERLRAIGAELGFAFNYADDMRMVNTFAAHQLLHWAEEQGLGHALQLALFSAFFSARKNLADGELLADVAAGVGLDRAEALRVLQTQERASAVREQQRYWLERGIDGVPAMVFEGRRLLTGARGEESYAQLLRRMAPEGSAQTSEGSASQ